MQFVQLTGLHHCFTNANRTTDRSHTLGREARHGGGSSAHEPIGSAGGGVGYLAELVANAQMTQAGQEIRGLIAAALPLVAAVTQTLVREGQLVLVDTFRNLSTSRLFRRYQTLQRQRDALARLCDAVAERCIAPRQASLDAYLVQHRDASAKGVAQPRLDTLRNQIAGLSGQMAAPKALKHTANRLIVAFDTFASTVATTPQSGAQPALLQAALREPLHHGASTPCTHVLYLGVDSVGDEVVVRKGLFGQAKKATFLGGCQVSYLLARANGAPVLSDTLCTCAQLTFDLKSSTAREPMAIRIGKDGTRTP